MTAQLASQKLSITIEAGPVIKSEGRFSSAAFSPDGASIITISKAGCDLWDAQTGQHMKKLTLGDAGYRTRADVSKRHYDALYPQTDDDIIASLCNQLANMVAQQIPSLSPSLGSRDGWDRSLLGHF